MAGGGGPLGSVVPGLETAVGAIIGGVAGGIGASLAMDSLLLEIEEHVRRPDSVTRLLSAIDEAEQDTLHQLTLISR